MAQFRANTATPAVACALVKSAGGLAAFAVAAANTPTKAKA